MAAEPSSSSSSNTRYGVATLTLRDTNGHETGSLIVQLLEPVVRGNDALIDSASRDPEAAPPPALVPDAAQEFSDYILDSFRLIVEKAKIIVDLVGEAAKVRISLFRNVRYIYETHVNI